MLKKIIVGLIVILAILGVGLYYLGANMDSIVRAAIEKYGTEATQTTVKLDGVKITLASGEAALTGLSVGSPKGFSADKALYLGNIAVKLDAKSVTGTGPIVIQDITIEKPQITYEVNNSGASNLQTISKNAQAYANSFGGGKQKAAKAEGSDKTEAKEQPGRKFVINSLTVKDGQIAITQEALQGKQLSATLSVIRLTNIGKSEGGATTAEIAEQLLGTITTTASQVASSSLAKELGDTLKQKGEDAIGGAGGVGEKIKGLLGE